MGETNDLLYWLVTEGAHGGNVRTVIEALIARLHDNGVEVGRVAISHPTLHPEIFAIAYEWRSDIPMQEHRIPHSAMESQSFLSSPLRALLEGAGGIRRRLEGDAPLDYPVLQEFRERGYTDYVAMPLIFTDGRRGTATWCTLRQGGFRSDELAQIDAALPGLALLTEMQAARHAMTSLLDTYLGQDPSARIRTGRIRRGQGESVRAVIWYCDMRGFTALSERVSRDRLIEVLNDYFETMAEPVHAFGGEVLKFIGDAMLAIFRVDEGNVTDAEACETALLAARAAMARMRQLNNLREGEGRPALGYGIALHIGEVNYGNVGAPTRLDFTVIGPAVNLAARLETLAGSLGHSLVASAAFAACAARDFHSIGHFSLKNLIDPQEAFVPINP